MWFQKGPISHTLLHISCRSGGRLRLRWCVCVCVYISHLFGSYCDWRLRRCSRLAAPLNAREPRGPPEEKGSCLRRCFPFDVMLYCYAAVCAAYQISCCWCCRCMQLAPVCQTISHTATLSLSQQLVVLLICNSPAAASFCSSWCGAVLSPSISEAINKRAASSISRALHPPHTARGASGFVPLVSAPLSVFESSRL